MSIIDPPLERSMRVAQNDQDDRAGLPVYVQFNEHTRPHTRARARKVTPGWVTYRSIEWVDYRVGLRSYYVQFKKYTHTHTHTHRQTQGSARRSGFK